MADGLHPKAKYFEYAEITNPVREPGLFCLSGSTWRLCKGLLDFYGDWRSRYVQELETQYPLPVTDEQWEIIQDALDLAQLEMGIDMNCDFTAVFGELSAAIEKLATSSQGCCGPAAYGTQPVPATTETGDIPTETPPPGFDTWEEYTTYKCRAANKIVDDYIASVANLQSVGGLTTALATTALIAFLNTSLLSGILVGIMAVGFSAGTAAAVIIGALVILAAGGVSQWSIFGDLETYFETNKQEIVCRMFDATSPEDARVAFNGFAITATASYPSAVRDAFYDLQGAMVRYEVFNTLFEEDPDASDYVGTIDCAVCAPGGLGWVIAFGTDVDNVPSNINTQWCRVIPANPGNNQLRACIARDGLNFSPDGIMVVEGGGTCAEQLADVGGPIWASYNHQNFRYTYICNASDNVEYIAYPLGPTPEQGDDIYHLRLSANSGVTGDYYFTTDETVALTPPVPGWTVNKIGG